MCHLWERSAFLHRPCIFIGQKEEGGGFPLRCLTSDHSWGGGGIDRIRLCRGGNWCSFIRTSGSNKLTLQTARNIQFHTVVCLSKRSYKAWKPRPPAGQNVCLQGPANQGKTWLKGGGAKNTCFQKMNWEVSRRPGIMQRRILQKRSSQDNPVSPNMLLKQGTRPL